MFLIELEQEIAAEIAADDEEERRRRARRRGSTMGGKMKVTRQRSYDDEIKTTAMGSSQSSHPDVGLGLPAQLPRRASAYDVYATPGGGGLSAMALVSAQHRASFSGQGDLFFIILALDKQRARNHRKQSEN